MKFLFLLLLTLSGHCFGNTEEELFVRRIETLWQDKDDVFLKQQLTQFFQKFPSSHSTPRFTAMLGDLAFQEKKFEEALTYYNQIDDPYLKKCIQGKKWHSQYRLKHNHDLIVEIVPTLFKENPEARFYLAQACLSEGSTLQNKNQKAASALLEEALCHFESLLENPIYEGRARLGLANVHKCLGHSADSLKYYLEISETLANNFQEDILLIAACALKDVDNNATLKIAKHLTKNGKRLQNQGASLWFYLLAKNKNYDEIVGESALFLSTLPEEKKPLLHSTLGRIYYERKEWQSASEHLEKAQDPTFDLMLAKAHRLSNRSEKAFEILKNYLEKHPQDDSALFEKAILLMEQQKWEEALSILEPLPQNKYRSLHMGMCLVALKKIDPAIALLLPLIENYPIAHHALMLAFQEKQDPLNVVFHGEKALDLESIEKERPKIHLHLFNAYLALARENQDEEYHVQAANHLFAAIEKEPVTVENRLWLANHFAKKAIPSFDPKEAAKAISLLEPLLAHETDFFVFEKEIIDCANLYEITDEKEKSYRLLLKLLDLQARSPDFVWKYGEVAKLKLANLYFAKGQMEKACALYRTLEQTAEKKIALNATLNLTRAHIAQLETSDFYESNPEIASISSKLKELKIPVSLTYEPIHLEAAIEFAEFSSMLAKPEERNKKLVELLIEAKESFLQNDNIASKDYHLSLEMMPQAARIYFAYMRYLDARINQLQAEIAAREGNTIESNTKEKAAFALFSSLKSNKYALTKYLKEHTSYE